MKERRECKKIRVKINAYIDNELTAEEQKVVAGHILGCEYCRKEYDSLKRVNALLNEYHQEDLPQSLKNRLYSIPEQQGGFRKGYSVPRKLAVLPTAAAILLTLFSALFLGRTFLAQTPDSAYLDEDYQLAQSSFYDMWEMIGYE
jgi:predicted anti-sigma-YlaC factor YlaD